MAKWGEGDPRWIVEDRPDATNVNNWHWSEKNASSWSKDKFNELLVGMNLIKDGLGTVSITGINKCEGEATANNRKGKLIFFYEWVLKLDWQADLDDPDAAECKGTIEIPNLSEENEPHEIDVNVTVTEGGSSGENVKTFLRKEGTEQIQAKLADYIKGLKEEYGVGLLLPTNQTQAPTKSKTVITSKNKVSDSSVNAAVKPLSNMDLSCPGTKLDVKSLNLKQSFKCRVEDLYNVFTMNEMVTAFTRNKVKMNPVKGGVFELFDGNITGTFVELESNKRIVQQWRFKTWPEGHYSVVTLDMIQQDDCTELTLQQTAIPVNDYERTKTGWHNYYWESIKRTFGFGATLM